MRNIHPVLQGGSGSETRGLGGGEIFFCHLLGVQNVNSAYIIMYIGSIATCCHVTAFLEGKIITCWQLLLMTVSAHYRRVGRGGQLAHGPMRQCLQVSINIE